MPTRAWRLRREARQQEQAGLSPLERIAQLGTTQRRALKRLIDAEGESCAMDPRLPTTLLRRALLEVWSDPITGVPLLCVKGCQHPAYHIPEAVREAYAAWATSTEVQEPAAPAPPVVPATCEEDPPMAATDPTPLVWVRFTIPGMGFFTYYGTNCDRGQLMPMVGGPRDEQLQRMGYVQPAPHEEAHLRAQCGACGCWFLTEQFRDMHGRLRHSDRFASDLDIGGGMQGPDGGAALRDVTGDAEERRMQQQYPLYMDRTRATLESGAA